MPRLFVAIDLPAAACDSLTRLRSPLTGARWAGLARAHLTLRFIGAVDSAVAAQIQEALATIQTPGGRLELAEVGTFPARGTPRVLWLGVREDRWLMDLQEQVEATVAECGLRLERQRFMPHITLARLRRPDARQLQQFLEEHRHYATESFTVREFVLYSSELQPQGAHHTKEAGYPLQTTEG